MLGDQFPKLLIVTEFPPNASGGGPAVVRQMLRGWPTKKLFWWSCFPERDTRFKQEVNQAACALIPQKFVPHRRLTTAKSAFLAYGWAPYAKFHLAHTMRRVQPDVVWVIPHNWSILPAGAVLLRSRVGFHVSIHDYVDVHGLPKKIGQALCQRMADLTDRLYTDATTRDAISHPMVADLRFRTAAEAAQVVHAGLEEEDFHYLATKTATNDPVIRIAYAGTILVPKEFALVVTALLRLRSQISKPVSLEFFGSHSYANEPWFDRRWMREHGNLPENELLVALRTCNWGFSPMSLTDHDPRYNRFSLPTKFISYLAAGLPIITLGHIESCVIQTAKRYTIGLATSASDLKTLQDQLYEVLAFNAPWQKYGSEIIRCAKVEFNATEMRSGLHSCLEDCTRTTLTNRATR